MTKTSDQKANIRVTSYKLKALIRFFPAATVNWKWFFKNIYGKNLTPRSDFLSRADLASIWFTQLSRTLPLGSSDINPLIEELYVALCAMAIVAFNMILMLYKPIVWVKYLIPMFINVLVFKSTSELSSELLRIQYYTIQLTTFF